MFYADGIQHCSLWQWYSQNDLDVLHELQVPKRGSCAQALKVHYAGMLTCSSWQTFGTVNRLGHRHC